MECDNNLTTLLSTQNTTTATLVVLNSLHTTLVLSVETEKQLVLGAFDIAYQNFLALETALTDLRSKNSSLAILNAIQERVQVLRDVLYVETEKAWNDLVRFSEQGDIQLTIQKYPPRTQPPNSTESTTILEIVGIAQLLDSLNLLESVMKSLSSLLSRAFLTPLLSNPVGWQFIYRKNDPTNPSITMKPTNYTLPNLIPHGCIFVSLHIISNK